MEYLKKEFYQIVRQFEEVFEFIEEYALDGIWFWDLEQPQNKWVNRKFCTLLGYDYHELQGNQLKKILYKEDLAMLTQIIVDYKRSPENIHEHQLRFVHKKGHLVWLRCRALTLKNPKGISNRVLVTHMDDTIAHEHEEYLQETLKYYESILNNNTTFILRTDLEGNYTYANKYFYERFVPDDMDSVIGINSMFLIVEEDRQKCFELVQRCIQEPETPFFLQLRKQVATNEIVYTQWEFRAVKDYQDNVCEIQCVGIEVTQQVLIEQRLSHAKELLQTCNSIAQIGIWQMDLTKSIVEWDKITKKIHEVELDYESTIENAINFYKEGESRNTIQHVLDDALQNGKSYDVELQIKTAKGNEIWVRTIGIPVMVEGKCVELYGTFQNINEQKRQQIERKQRLLELEALRQQVDEAQQKLKTTLEKTGVGLWELDFNTNEAYWDNQTRRLYGEVDTDFEASDWRQKIYEEDLPAVQNAIQEFVEGKRANFEVSARVHRNANKTTYLLAKGILTKDHGSLKLFGTIQDITAQIEFENIIKRQNEALLDSQAMLEQKVEELSMLREDLDEQKKHIEQIFDAVPALIYQFKLDKRGNMSFPLTSRGIKEILGFSSLDLDNADHDDVINMIHPDDMDAFSAAVKESARTMKKWESDLRLVVDGKSSWVHATSKPTHVDEQGVIWTGIMQNIDHIKDTEQKLYENNAKLQSTLDELKKTQAQLIHNEKMATLGQLVASIAHEINTPLGAIRSLSESNEKLITTAFPNLSSFFASLAPELVNNFNLFIQKSIETNEYLSTREKRAFKYDLIDRLQDKKIDNADWIVEKLIDIGIYKDIETFESLLQSDNAKEILNMAYQISTVAKNNHIIQVATEQSAKIILNLKNFSRQGNATNKTYVDVNHSLESTLLLYHNKLKYGIEVVRDFGALPPVEGYEDELVQVWTNLIHNAIQAMDGKGKLFIKTQRQNGHVKVCIKDTGQGIPLHIQQQIFDPFFTTKETGEGSGLGLSIVKKITDKHHGKIWFESGENKGTTFFVELPINQ